MIDIIIANIEDIDESKYQQYLMLMPHEMNIEVLKYKFKEDRYRTLLGKIILLNYLKRNTNFNLSHIELTQYKKPYIPNSNLNFNISHSGQYVVCAFANSHQVGIDIEACKDIDLNDFKIALSQDEFSQIQNSSKKLKEFYTIWTIKEAVLKAVGKGLINNIKDLKINNNVVYFQKEQYYIQSFKQDSYIYSIACSNKSKINFLEMKDL